MLSPVVSTDRMLEYRCGRKCHVETGSFAQPTREVQRMKKL